MSTHKIGRSSASLCAAILLTIAFALLNATAQDNFNKAEFAARRAKVFDKIGDAAAVVFANQKHRYPVKFRQAPDFYYLTGIEEPDAILVLNGKDKRSYVFARLAPPWQKTVEGPGLLDDKNAAEMYGLSGVMPLGEFFTFLTPQMTRAAKIYAPLTPPDDLQFARRELLIDKSEAVNYPLNSNVVRYQEAVEKLKKWQPQAAFVDVNPILDELRRVKSPYEIERMRMTGRIGAEGVREAIKGTRGGMFEYELEAAARFIYTKRGARGDAFTPIVASGPNTMILHYTNNNRQMKDGDVVLMDYGSDYDYYTSDVTRTWAVSGKFTPEQEKMYRCILDARNAIIAVMKPGVKVSDMQAAAEKVYKKYGFAKEFAAFDRYVGHFVGLSVHDVGDEEAPFVAGVTFNVEPLIQNEKLRIHMRLEDTVLITPTGAENLTASVPAEIEELYALQRRKPLAPGE